MYIQTHTQINTYTNTYMFTRSTHIPKHTQTQSNAYLLVLGIEPRTQDLAHARQTLYHATPTVLNFHFQSGCSSWP